MNKFKVGAIVSLIGHEGKYEIIASSTDKRKSSSGLSLPPAGYDYTFKRMDGFMDASFEPYQNLNENLIISEISD